MASLNKVQIIGNLGRDPEVKNFANGKKAEFTVAVTEKWKDRSGADQQITEWFNVVFWGKQAEICEQYLRKGASVYVEGKLRTRSWDDQNGQKHYRTELQGDLFQMLGSRTSGSGNPSYQGESYPSRQSPPASDSHFAPTQNYASAAPVQGMAEDDDLPF